MAESEAVEINFVAGGLNNRHDALKLGLLTKETGPEVSVLTEAVNVDIDNNDLASLRDGRTEIYAGAPHSFWADPRNDQIAYFIEDGILKRLVPGGDQVVVVANLGSNAEGSFEALHESTVFSNGTIIGWLHGYTLDLFAAPPTMEAGESLMPAGQILSFDHGDSSLLVASGNTIFKSKPYDGEVYDDVYGIFPMDGPVQMLGAVEDGWWVGTNNHVSFVQRVENDGFKFVHVSDFVPAPGMFLTGFEKTKEGKRKYVCWASKDGICIGRAGGQIQMVTGEEIELPIGTSGRLIYRTRNGIKQFIVIIREPKNLEKYTAPILNVTTISL